MKFYFDEQVAQDVGVEAAILLSNIEHWVEKSAANGANFYDGHFWTYNSKRVYAQFFPFWTERQVRRLLEKLLNAGYIKSGNYNKKNYDKTLWYTSLREEFLDRIKSLGPNGPIEMTKSADEEISHENPNPWTKRSNGSAQTVQPIPETVNGITVNGYEEGSEGKRGSTKTKNNENGNGSKKSPIAQLPKLDQSEEKTELIAQQILEKLGAGDKHSAKFHYLVASRIPDTVIFGAIEDGVTSGAKNLAKLFSYRMSKYAEEKILAKANVSSMDEVNAAREELMDKYWGSWKPSENDD